MKVHGKAAMNMTVQMIYLQVRPLPKEDHKTNHNGSYKVDHQFEENFQEGKLLPRRTSTSSTGRVKTLNRYRKETYYA